MALLLKAMVAFCDQRSRLQQAANHYVYSTADAAATVTAANYFNGAASPNNLKKGDRIYCSVNVDATPGETRPDRDRRRGRRRHGRLVRAGPSLSQPIDKATIVNRALGRLGRTPCSRSTRKPMSPSTSTACGMTWWRNASVFTTGASAGATTKLTKLADAPQNGWPAGFRLAGDRIGEPLLVLSAVAPTELRSARLRHRGGRPLRARAERLGALQGCGRSAGLGYRLPGGLHNGARLGAGGAPIASDQTLKDESAGGGLRNAGAGRHGRPVRAADRAEPGGLARRLPLQRGGPSHRCAVLLMAAQAGRGQHSMNAGEFSKELAGRIDIKQYYRPGLRFLNVEPVAQAGSRNLPGTRGVWVDRDAVPPSLLAAASLARPSFLDRRRPYRIDIFEGTALVAQISTAITPEIAADVSLYISRRTRSSSSTAICGRCAWCDGHGSWTLGDWPFRQDPRAGLWRGLFEDARHLAAVHPLRRKPGGQKHPTSPSASTPRRSSTTARQQRLQRMGCRHIRAQLRALPSLNNDVRVDKWIRPRKRRRASRARLHRLAGRAGVPGHGADREHEFRLRTAVRTRRSDDPWRAADLGRASWPGVVSIAQDRLLRRAAERPSALLFSQTAEYFTINTRRQRATGQASRRCGRTARRKSSM